MPKLYIDTNKFLNFYQSPKERLVVLEEVSKHFPNIVTTTQTVQEFYRNRVKRLRELQEKFENSNLLKVKEHASFMDGLEAFKGLKELADRYNAQMKAIEAEINSMIEDESKDPVAKVFDAYLKSTTPLVVTDEIIARAHRRKLLGNPPTTSEKYSIGDEVIWETLSHYVNEDLVIVSGDKSFVENCHLLRMEFEARPPRKLIKVVELFSQGITALGQKPSKELIDQERKAEAEQKEAIRINMDAPFTKRILRSLQRAAAAKVAANAKEEVKAWAESLKLGDVVVD